MPPFLALLENMTEESLVLISDRMAASSPNHPKTSSTTQPLCFFSTLQLIHSSWTQPCIAF